VYRAGDRRVELNDICVCCFTNQFIVAVPYDGRFVNKLHRVVVDATLCGTYHAEIVSDVANCCAYCSFKLSQA